MGKLVSVMSVTLDGVIQAPGRPDEDTRGGFTHGGWGRAYNDDVMGAEMGKRMAGGGPILLGRNTYLAMYDYWPRRADNPYTNVLNAASKHVVSATLTEPLPWQNSILVKGGADLEETCPLVLGEGQRLFDGIGRRIELDLKGSVSTSKGVVITTYRAAS
ncbi:dihydrofolate reductase family protein [Intrasporangium sp.]|uniref:dihydrofolate reductase family protein n=1 Tax=Intrasporangium sp. TaxID=1925024 RepID=UPI0029396689|nr:dihydrofolate reductase family protein [Intrasporangium sp.]MDV3220233.1 dihydrofolate reductase family protein [Intrasporangium sp.]